MSQGPKHSTIRSEGGGLKSRELFERGIMWVAPEPSFLPFPDEKLVLGRDEDCQCVLRGGQVSRYHAELEPEGGLMVLRDRGSTNGTHHNGLRIEQSFLSTHDVVRLGEWVGVVCSVPRGSSATVERIDGMYAGHRVREVLRAAERVASSDLPVILQGESGTGKEMLARYVHDRSGRRGPFVAVNCAALPESLAEAELFGHTRGAFTGADRTRSGYLRSSDHGTLLLDEVSDLPLPIQAKLLRALEERSVTPLGESRPVSVDLRVIAAGQKPLEALIEDGKFRGDLYARLNGIKLVLPPLRERREEVPYIFGAVLREQGRPVPLLQPRLVERLCLWNWPFNVRELVQVTRRIAALYAGEPALHDDCLPPHMAETTLESGSALVEARATTSHESRGSTVPAPPGEPRLVNLGKLGEDHRAQELAALENALRTHGGSVTNAARALGISRQKVYRMIEAHPELGLDAYRKRD